MSGAGEVAMFLYDLRHQLAEVEERLDFAERLLTHDAPANQLPGRAQQ